MPFAGFQGPGGALNISWRGSESITYQCKNKFVSFHTYSNHYRSSTYIILSGIQIPAKFESSSVKQPLKGAIRVIFIIGNFLCWTGYYCSLDLDDCDANTLHGIWINVNDFNIVVLQDKWKIVVSKRPKAYKREIRTLQNQYFFPAAQHNFCAISWQRSSTSKLVCPIFRHLFPKSFSALLFEIMAMGWYADPWTSSGRTWR